MEVNFFKEKHYTKRNYCLANFTASICKLKLARFHIHIPRKSKLGVVRSTFCTLGLSSQSCPKPHALP